MRVGSISVRLKDNSRIIEAAATLIMHRANGKASITKEQTQTP